MMWSQSTQSFHTESVDGAVVAYDTANDLVHCVSDDSLLVMGACQGVSAAEISECTGLSEATVAAHLRELSERGLVTATGGDDLSRKRLLAMASGAAALAVWTMAAPTPAAAASGSSPVTTAGPNNWLATSIFTTHFIPPIGPYIP